MPNHHNVPISELLEALASDLSAGDVLYAKLSGEISTRISAERIKRGMNQTEFAQFMGTTQAQISKWERGNQNFTVKTLSEIACKLGFTLTISFDETAHTQTPLKNNIIHLPEGYFGVTSLTSKGSQVNSWDDDLKEL